MCFVKNRLVIPLQTHLNVIEASGIADPAKIANVAVAEPDLVYQGIITVVDGANILDQLVDRFVGDQVRDQIRVADLIYVAKTELSDHLSMQLATLSKAPILESDAATIEMLLQINPFFWNKFVRFFNMDISCGKIQI